MTRHSPSYPWWCVACVAVGSIVGTLLGWLSYEGDEGV